MAYSVSCTCGHALKVEAVDAGGTLVCLCGETVSVPALSMLRQQAGQSSYPVNVADKLLAMNQAGELPTELVCARCGIGTKTVLPCSLVCETAYVKRTSIWETLAWMWLSPLAMLSNANADDHVEPRGRDLTVPTPLRLCDDCMSLVRTKKKQILALLDKTATYRELLALYPHAVVELET